MFLKLKIQKVSYLIVFLLCFFFSNLTIAKIKNAMFSDDYKKSNNGEWTVEVPEVRELVNIIFAITPQGISGEPLNLYRIMDEGEEYRKYYQDVLEHFLPFYNHSIVKEFNDLLIEAKYVGANYPSFNLNSYSYVFKKNKIVNTNIHNFFWSKKENSLKRYIKELEDFALKSNFREFYKNHKKFYSKIINVQKAKVPIDKQWKWLETHFSNKANAYRILISPLVYGYHCFGKNKANNFLEIVMSINAPGASRMGKGEVLQRTIFTEIDHNYVNPVSEIYEKEINEAFEPISLWAKEGHGYGKDNKQNVFNEYMTWAVFLLYIHDTSSKEILSEAEEVTIKKMEGPRKFIRFGEFYRKVLKIYIDRKANQTITDLYPEILKKIKNKKMQSNVISRFLNSIF